MSTIAVIATQSPISQKSRGKAMLAHSGSILYRAKIFPSSSDASSTSITIGRCVVLASMIATALHSGQPKRAETSVSSLILEQSEA